MLTSSMFAQNMIVNEMGRYTDGRETACEISTYDKGSQRLFSTNAAVDSIDVIDVSNPTSPVLINQIDVLSYGGGVNSLVSIGGGYIAAAIQNTVKTDNGFVVIFGTDGAFVAQVTVGALPDMITYAPTTQKLLVACEGEPDDDYIIDPNGSIAIVDLSNGVAGLSQTDVILLTFDDAPTTIPGSLRKPGTTWSQDLEPEYIAVSGDESWAMVNCQESNVFIKVDLVNNVVSDYIGLGFKDHSLAGNGFDASDKDDVIDIKTWNVLGVYQPDAIAMFEANSNTYVVTANEGDGRDYDGYSSEVRVEDLTLDETVYLPSEDTQNELEMGRLKTLQWMLLVTLITMEKWIKFTVTERVLSVFGMKMESWFGIRRSNRTIHRSESRELFQLQ